MSEQQQAELEHLAAAAEAEPIDGEYLPGSEPEQPEPEPEQPTLQPRDLLALGFQALATIVASRAGPHWALDDAEATGLGEAWEPIVVKYIGDVNVGPWGVALATSAMVFGPKIKAHGDYIRAQARKREQQQHNGKTAGVDDADQSE